MEAGRDITLKPVVWIGSSRNDLKDLSSEVQLKLGYALYLSQIGETSPKARVMHGNLRDVTEIETEDSSGTYRLMYTVKLGDIVYVLHAFQKKSKSGVSTPQSVLELIEHRLKKARLEHEKENH